jgi:hypothetical protein
MALELRVERSRRRPALGDDRLGFAERHTTEVPLCAERNETLARDPHILVEAYRLFAELADLQTHLLATLEETLQVSLDLLHRLPEITEPMLADLDRFALGGFARREACEARA